MTRPGLNLKRGQTRSDLGIFNHLHFSQHGRGDVDMAPTRLVSGAHHKDSGQSQGRGPNNGPFELSFNRPAVSGQKFHKKWFFCSRKPWKAFLRCLVDVFLTWKMVTKPRTPSEAYGCSHSMSYFPKCLPMYLA